jgi:hypothetical protein
MIQPVKTLFNRPWTPAKVLTQLEALALLLSAISLVLLLAATPPFECGRDYESPATPLHSGGLALVCLIGSVIGLLVGIGLKLGLPRGTGDQSWATRGLLLATVVLLVAGGAVFADAARWTCWP